MKIRLLIFSLALSPALTTGQAGITRRQTQPQASAASKSELSEAEGLNTTVVKLYNQRKFNEALPIAKRVLEIRQKALPADDDLIIAALTNLAEIQQALGKSSEAKGPFEKALRSQERASGADSPAVARLLDRLAVINYAAGNPDQTESHYKRALAIREKTLGSDHEDTARSVYNLAEFYQFEGNYKTAEPLYLRLVEIRRKNSAKQPASLSDALVRYACLLRKSKRQDEASQLEEQAYGSPDTGSGTSRGSLSAGIVNGRAASLVTPPYPPEARTSRASGKVTVQVLIDETGRVIRACAIQGPGLLMKASESAAYRSTFTPTTLEGKPVKVNGVIIYNFVAQ